MDSSKNGRWITPFQKLRVNKHELPSHVFRARILQISFSVLQPPFTSNMKSGLEAMLLSSIKSTYSPTPVTNQINSIYFLTITNVHRLKMYQRRRDMIKNKKQEERRLDITTIIQFYILYKCITCVKYSIHMSRDDFAIFICFIFFRT